MLSLAASSLTPNVVDTEGVEYALVCVADKQKNIYRVAAPIPPARGTGQSRNVTGRMIHFGDRPYRSGMRENTKVVPR